MSTMSKQHIETHIPVLGWLYVITHALLFLIGILILLLLVGIGIAIGDRELIRIMSVVSIFVGSLFTLIALPGIAAGLGLLRRKPWGRVLALAIGVLGVLNFPIGTIVGVYALYVLLQTEASEFFS